MAKAAKGNPSPANLRNKATPLVVPPSPVKLPAPPVIVAPKPNVGIAPETGASNHAGPGQGAGGEGNGYGGGGEGDGGDNAPQPIRDQLKISWLPEDVRHMINGTMQVTGVRFSVETDGRVGTCQVMRSSGNRALDEATCAAIQQHFKYKPARDSDGKPFATHVFTTEGWQMDRDEDASSRSGP
ncbi:energy transducer TonB [Nostoc sp. 3335mG]|nr:energy transducer TonB [Nostoc sp. 3335mG]